MKLPFARTPINRTPVTEPPTAEPPATRAPATSRYATRRSATRTLGAALVAVTMLLTACSGSASTPGTEAATTIRMGIQPWIGYGQWHVANDQGISAKHNIDVQLTELTDDADQSAAFASGRIDMDNIEEKVQEQYKNFEVDDNLHTFFYKINSTLQELLGGKATTSIETEEVRFFAENEIPSDLSIPRVNATQIARFFEHLRHPDWPTEFD